VLRAGNDVVANFSGLSGNGVHSDTWLNVPRGTFVLEATGYDAVNAPFSVALRNVTVLPAGVLDQQQTNWGSTVFARPGTNYAQTFTPSVDGELHHIEMYLFPNHFAQVHPVNVTVVETIAGAPTGRVLGQTSIPNVDQSGAARSAYFPTAPVLRAGVLYAFIVSPTSQTNGITIRTAFTDDPYPRGAIWRQRGNGPWEQAEREPNLYADMVFATYMTPRSAPQVTLSNPGAGAQFRAGDSIELGAMVTDADSANASVDFFAGGIHVGTVATPPYEIVWANVPAGNFPLTAVATDEIGLSTRSAAVSIHVRSTNLLPRVSVLDALVFEGARTNFLIVPLVLSAPATNAVTVQYSTADGTAAATSDYEATSGVVIFEAGTTNVSISIPVFGDQLNEQDEFLLVNLLSVTGANFDRVQGIGTILDDEFGPGKVHHFAFSQIPSPQTTNRPFFVSITALDVSNSIVTNFSGDVALSFLSAPTDLGKTFLGGVSHTVVTNPETSPTLGYAFTPNTNLLVTGVRHYAGHYMSLWTDDGVLVFKHELPRTAGSWVDSTLAAPVALKAGRTYRLAFFTGGLNWYGGVPPNDFLHGTFGPAFERNGEGFPDGPAPAFWPLADLRYEIDTPVPPPVVPASVGPFVNGRWSGMLSFEAPPFSDVRLRAEDALGRIGLSQVFSMNRAPTVTIVEPLPGTLFYVGSPVTVTAMATDPEGGPVRVEFLQEGELLHTALVGPSASISFEWTNAPAGESTITVRAVDALGASSSAAIVVRVLRAPRAIAAVRFDPPAIPGGSRLVQDWLEHGFSFHGPNGMAHTDSASSPGLPQSGSAYLQFLSGQLPLIITNTSQLPFSLLSAQLAEYSTLFAEPRNIEFVGVRADGSQVSHLVTLDGIIDGNGILEDFETFVFPPEFTGLVRVEVAMDLYSLENVRIAADFPDAPDVVVTSPRTGQGFAPEDVVFDASVSAPTGSIDRVDFHVDGSFIGSAFAAPYRFPWPSLPLGPHTVVATAFSSLGIEVASEPVEFRITARPQAAITAPTNGAIVTVGEPVTLQANAADEDGHIAEVIFFDGTNVLGSVTNSPFWLVWSNFVSGNHSLSAVAIDDLGVRGHSAVIQVVANIPPTVSLRSPGSEVVLQPGQLIHFSADAEDADGTIAFVEFYLGTNLIGRVFSPPYEVDFVAAASGPFCATAVAVDNHGARRSHQMAGRVNQHPTATIQVPSAQSAFIAPATIAISGVATDADGAVRTIFVSAGDGFSARFDIGESRVGEGLACDSESPGTPHQVPFACVWSNAPPGIHTIRSYAVDSDGASSPLAETTVFNFNYLPFHAEWTATNTVRRSRRVRFVQRVTISNPTAVAFSGGELLVHLDRRSILRGVRVVDAARMRRGVFRVPLPELPSFGTASVEIYYAAPNRRRLPEPVIVPVVR
jgi:hypothetical protein